LGLVAIASAVIEGFAAGSDAVPLAVSLAAGGAGWGAGCCCLAALLSLNRRRANTSSLSSAFFSWLAYETERRIQSTHIA